MDRTKPGTKVRQTRSKTISLSLICLLILGACQLFTPEQAQPTIAQVPTESARAEEQATAVPTATVTEPPILIPTVTLITSSQATPTSPSCFYEYFFTPAPPTCPEGEAIASAAAEQAFEGGVMIWLETADSIYVLFEDQSWQRFDDNWTEDQPESDPSFTPPEGLYQPIRGFGKVWRENLRVRQELGWAVGVELGFESQLQEEQTAPGTEQVTFIRTFNGQIYALLNRGEDQGEWVIATS